MKDREGKLVEQILSVKTQADLTELRRTVADRLTAGLLGKRKAKRLHALLDDLEHVVQGRLIARITTLSSAAQDVARAFDRLRSPERRERVIDLVRAERDAETREQGGSEVRFGGPPGMPPWPVT